ncbi:MAG: methyltransferase domain-containing protein [Acidobacteriota bacterium]|nr:methyltransferase domain-containing protein [Acidobacteriota bacterium]
MAEPARIDVHRTEGAPHRRPVSANSGGDLREALDDFLELKEMVAAREGDRALHDQPQMVSRFYDVVTKFYEYGWGQSFHFSPRRSGEGLLAAQRRHETGVGELLALGPGSRVADIGCGVAGPLVTIAKATGASITGINLNAYQIARGQRSLRRAGLHETCGFLLASYMDVPLDDGYFDAAYSFESTCHAPDKALCFEELYRLLRPGGELALIDWCLTEDFDEHDPVHRDIRDRLEFGNATPNLLTTSSQLDLVRAVGFEILSSCDQALECDPDTPWYRSLQGRDLSLASLGRIPAGRWFTARATSLLELMRIAPAGTGEAARILNVAADSLVEAGVAGIFTPSFLIHARKPGGSVPS